MAATKGEPSPRISGEFKDHAVQMVFEAYEREGTTSEPTEPTVPPCYRAACRTGEEPDPHRVRRVSRRGRPRAR
jgi:hypothetical protein